jgi:hypothetical protein
MTCNELQDSVKHGLVRVDGAPRGDILSHLESCTACRKWVEIEQRLKGLLQVLRSSVPAVPTTVDASVLSAFRTRLQHAPGIPLRKPERPMSSSIWRAAIAALLLAGAIILFGNRKTAMPTPTAKIQVAPVVSSTQVQTQPQSEAPKPVVTKKRAASRLHHRAPAPLTENSSTEAASMGLPPDFRNLMYCDQLSCSGAMEVIRMNLPASSLGMALPSRTSNVVAADVVVGADGVARAIRIVN